MKRNGDIMYEVKVPMILVIMVLAMNGINFY